MTVPAVSFGLVYKVTPTLNGQSPTDAFKPYHIAGERPGSVAENRMLYDFRSQVGPALTGGFNPKETGRVASQESDDTAFNLNKAFAGRDADYRANNTVATSRSVPYDIHCHDGVGPDGSFHLFTGNTASRVRSLGFQERESALKQIVAEAGDQVVPVTVDYHPSKAYPSSGSFPNYVVNKVDFKA